MIKSIISELKKCLVTVFIDWIFDLLPDDNEFKLRFARFIEKNIDTL